MELCTDLKIKQLHNFKSLSEEARLELLKTSESITLPKGAMVFEENQPLEKLYCIQEGVCKFSKTDCSGQEHIVRFLGKGELMGKRALFSNKGAQVSATTLIETKLCCFDKEEITKQFQQNARFCHDYMNALIEDANINEGTRPIFCANKGIRPRLAQLLLYLAEKFGIDENGKLQVRLKREDMAAVLGTSQEYIINLLKRFKNLALIHTKRSEIYIRSKKGLEEIN